MLGRSGLLRGLVGSDSLLQLLQAELQLVRAQLLGLSTELLTREAQDQQPQLVVLGMQRALLVQHRPQHLLQHRGVARQGIEIDLHDGYSARHRRAAASLCVQNRPLYLANSGRRTGAGARLSHPSSRAASCGGESAIRPDDVVDGQTNWPCPTAWSACTSRPRHATAA